MTKHFIAAATFASFLAMPAMAEPNKVLYELQERCSKQATAWFEKEWGGSGIISDRAKRILRKPVQRQAEHLRCVSGDKGEGEDDAQVCFCGLADRSPEKQDPRRVRQQQ
jgi:hypothetical protein